MIRSRVYRPKATGYKDSVLGSISIEAALIDIGAWERGGQSCLPCLLIVGPEQAALAQRIKDTFHNQILVVCDPSIKDDGYAVVCIDFDFNEASLYSDGVE